MAQGSYNEGRMSEAFCNVIANSRDNRILDVPESNFNSFKILEKSEKLAHLILYGAKDIVSNDSVNQAKKMLRAIFEAPPEASNEKLCEHVMKIIDEQIGQAVVTMQAVAEVRLLNLILMGEEALIDSRTSDYFRRVSQCYLFGLDEQCLIMCRSVLEAAFLQAVPDSDCEKDPKVCKRHHKGQKQSEYFLSDRIKAARNKGILNGGLCELARSVNNIANDVLHANRELLRKLDQNLVNKILLETIQVVQALSETKVCS